MLGQGYLFRDFDIEKYDIVDLDSLFNLFRVLLKLITKMKY